MIIFIYFGFRYSCCELPSGRKAMTSEADCLAADAGAIWPSSPNVACDNNNDFIVVRWDELTSFPPRPHDPSSISIWWFPWSMAWFIPCLALSTVLVVVSTWVRRAKWWQKWAVHSMEERSCPMISSALMSCAWHLSASFIGFVTVVMCQ